MKHRCIKPEVLFLIGLLFSFTSCPMGQTVEMFGYFESQLNGQVVDDNGYLLQYNKLRIDLQKRPSDQIFFGANFDYINYNGDRTTNLLSFLPDKFDTLCHSCDAAQLFEFTYKDSIFLDNAFVQITHRLADLTIGRQQLSFGTGYAWNPTDIFNTKSLIDPTYEQGGHNAVRLDIPMSKAAMLTAIWSLEDESRHSSWFGRFKWSVPETHFDIALTAALTTVDTSIYELMDFTSEDRHLYGGDIVGEMMGWGLHSELAWNEMELSKDYLEALLGCDYTFSFQTSLLFEYYHNGSGRKRSGDYDLNDWMGLMFADSKTLSRDYLFAFIDHPAHDLINLGISTINNLNDGSMIINPQIVWYPFQDIEVTGIASIGLGDEGTEFGTFDPSGFLRVRFNY